MIAAERTALHIAAEDVQLTFLCAAITAGFALCHSFPPYPILPRAGPGIRGLPVAASVAYLCSHHVVAFPPGRVRCTLPPNKSPTTVDQRGVKLEIGVQHGPRYASYIPWSLLSFQTQCRGHGSAPKRVIRARRFTACCAKRAVHGQRYCVCPLAHSPILRYFSNLVRSILRR